MTNCPKCGKDIVEFRAYQQIWKHYLFRLDGYGMGEWEEDDAYDFGESETEFDCPHCDTTIFFNSDRAEEFLRGEKDDADE